MIRVVVSPAKSIDTVKPVLVSEFSIPRFIDRAERLVQHLRLLHPSDIEQLMGVSTKLAELNFQRFQSWHLPFTTSNARQAVYAFDGDVYDGLGIRSLDAAQVAYVGRHLRILSGLYGVLHPFDLIQPYRLEMGRKFGVDGARSLYDFWGSSITQALNDDFSAGQNPILVNLASEEYFKAIKVGELKARVVTPSFMEYKGDKPRIVALMAKRARGMMVRFMAEQQVDSVDDLKTFDYGGYSYSHEYSTPDRWVFVR